MSNERENRVSVRNSEKIELITSERDQCCPVCGCQ